MYLVNFKDIAKEDVKIAGGKGASLGEMYNNGIPVPPGFVVSVDTFIKHLKDNNIYENINRLLSSLTTDNLESIRKVSIEIQNLIHESNVTSEIKNEILERFSVLNVEFVAVRSSATSEDGQMSAWAGQLDSYLNTKRETLIENIKKCWASLFSERAIFYRLKNHDKSEISVAVIVQKMIQSDVSGVAFSVDPVTNNKNIIIIEAALGLGEAIVSGSVTPDNYKVTKNNLEIQKRKINKQEVIAKNETKIIDEKLKAKQTLTDKKIIELSTLIKDIEKHYGFPVDVEWALESDKIYIVQSRPITTVKTSKADLILTKIKNIGKWSYDFTMEFSWFVTDCLMVSTKRDFQMKEVGFALPFINCVYVNGDHYLAYKNQKSDFNISKKHFKGDIKFFEKLIARELEICERSRNVIKHLQNLKIKQLSNECLAEEFLKFTHAYTLSLALCFIRPYDFLEYELEQIIKKELKLKGIKALDIMNKIASNTSCYYPLRSSSEPFDLLNIARQPKNKWSSLLKKHIQKYSWMKAPLQDKEVEFTEEEYKKRLDFLLTEDIEKKIEWFSTNSENNDKEYEKIIKKYNFSPRGLAIVKAVRDNVFMHTNTAEHSDELFFRGRKLLINEIAERAGINIQDLMTLNRNEIYEIAKNGKPISNMKELVAERRNGYCVFWNNEETCNLFGSDANEIYQFMRDSVKNEMPEADIEKKIKHIKIKGSIANKGKVIGTVKVLLDNKDISKVEKGDIIVTPMTTPNLIAALEKASGFITDSGGITCHAAILSREFNVPCIVGTNNATEILKDGQKIELDAYNGIVTLVESDGLDK